MKLRTSTFQPKRLAAAVLASTLCVGLAACSDDDDDNAIADSASDSESSGSEEGSASDEDADASDLSGTISGAGSSAQRAAMEAWIAAFTDQHPDVTINYEPSGSGAGREQFGAGAVPFAGSDAALDSEETEKAREACNGDFLQVPFYVSPIAVAFNLDGVDELNLSPSTIAMIFDQEITNWNDEAIAEDNPDVELPDLEITPVNRSDKSGTTENFVDYLAGAAEDDWDHEVSGNWPVSGGEAAQGTSGVIGALEAGDGAIGYADASQVTSELGVVNVGVGDEFVGPSSEAAAKILESSERVDPDSDYNYAYELDRATEDEGTYPVVLITYSLACLQYDNEDDADLVKEFLTFINSEEGQEVAEEAAGSAPLTESKREEFQALIDEISFGDGDGNSEDEDAEDEDADEDAEDEDAEEGDSDEDADSEDDES